MRTVVNPPSLATLAGGWFRGGWRVLLSFALMWPVSFVVVPGGMFGSITIFLAVALVAWTGLIVLQCSFDHSLSVEGERLVLRTWIGSVLGTAGDSFPIQVPRMALAPRSGRGGAGLRSVRMWLIDDTGRQQMTTFTLISPDRLSDQVAESRLGRPGGGADVPTWTGYPPTPG